MSLPKPRASDPVPTQRACTEGSQSRLRALLLDFGSVISISVFERHLESEKLLGLPSGTLTWLGPLRPATDPLWESMQRDEITERQYWDLRAKEVSQQVGESGWTMQTLLQRIRQSKPDMVVRPEMAQLIAQAKAAGFKVGILSNELELFYGRRFLEDLSVLHHVEVMVDATHTRILKPDLRAYQLALDALNLPADEVLFVDDQFRNITGAVRAGLQTQYFDLRDISGNIAAIRARLKLPHP
jgi:putative hydrolase of the HAD superfamily